MHIGKDINIYVFNLEILLNCKILKKCFTFFIHTYIVSAFDYKVIMKDGMVPFEFQLEITTMAIELNIDFVIILSQGSFMSMVLVMYIRSVIIQMFIVMNIFTQFSLFGYYSHIWNWRRKSRIIFQKNCMSVFFVWLVVFSFFLRSLNC